MRKNSCLYLCQEGTPSASSPTVPGEAVSNVCTASQLAMPPCTEVGDQHCWTRSSMSEDCSAGCNSGSRDATAPFSAPSNRQACLHLSSHGQDWLLCMAKLKVQFRSSCASMRTISEGCQDIWGWGTAAFPPSRIDNPLQVVVSCLPMHLSVSLPNDGGS